MFLCAAPIACSIRSARRSSGTGWRRKAPTDRRRLVRRLWVNGKLKQEANTSDMVVGVAALIAAASELVTLEPGDVIATGTPDGVGLPRGEFLHPGDLVEMEVADFGRLSNRVEAESA